jgi:hypothetical protein
LGLADLVVCSGDEFRVAPRRVKAVLTVNIQGVVVITVIAARCITERVNSW